MTSQKRQRLMFVLLIGSVLFGLYMKPWVPPNKSESTAPTPEIAATEVAAAGLDPLNSQITYTDEWPKRDLFTRSDEYVVVNRASDVEAVSIGEPTFALQGILTMDGQMACVIDGETYMAGSQCSGWRLDKIEAGGVWVSQGGERRFVPLP